MQCLGLTPVEGSAEVLSSSTSTSTQVPDIAPPTQPAEQSQTPVSVTLPPLQIEPAAALRRIEPTDILLEIRPTDNVSLIIIDHQPTKLVYGRTDIAKNPINGTTASWNARKKFKCRCEANPAQRKVQVGEVTFTVKRLMIDCADVDIVELPKDPEPKKPERRQLELGAFSFVQTSSRRNSFRHTSSKDKIQHDKHPNPPAKPRKPSTTKDSHNEALRRPLRAAFAPSLSAASLPALERHRHRRMAPKRETKQTTKRSSAWTPTLSAKVIPTPGRRRAEAVFSLLEQDSRVNWQPTQVDFVQPNKPPMFHPVMMPAPILPPQPYYYPARVVSNGVQNARRGETGKSLEDEIERRTKEANEEAKRQRVSDQGRVGQIDSTSICILFVPPVHMPFPAANVGRSI